MRRRDAGPLPPGYTPLNYLESTGGQSIDTLWAPTAGEHELVCRFGITAGNAGFSLFGARTNTPAPVKRAGTYYFGTAYRPSVYVGTTSNQFTLPASNPHVIGTIYNLSLVVSESDSTFRREVTGEDGLMNLENAASFVGGTTTPDTLHLFSAKTQGVVAERGYFKVYGHRIYEAGALVRDMLPCLDGGGRPCMYCLVSKQTFYNVSGATDFLYG